LHQLLARAHRHLFPGEAFGVQVTLIQRCTRLKNLTPSVKRHLSLALNVMGAGPPVQDENRLYSAPVVDPGDVGLFLAPRVPTEFGAGASGTPHWGLEPAERRRHEEAPRARRHPPRQALQGQGPQRVSGRQSGRSYGCGTQGLERFKEPRGDKDRRHLGHPEKPRSECTGPNRGAVRGQRRRAQLSSRGFHTSIRVTGWMLQAEARERPTRARLR